MDDLAIKVENVSKTFKLPHENQSSIKSIFVNAFNRKKGYELQNALNDVSFEVKKSEFFGIVGRNGSGKSTLLKLLAGIYTPTRGRIQVKGSLTPFIELGVGFSPELTGRENVFLNGSLLGFNRKEMQNMYDDIVGFAELGKFMDQKLKNYSSGMQVRLAFSIAIRAESDILLIDEVLAVGDANFQKKCLDTFKNIKKSGRTVVLVTHDMHTMEAYCDRALLINNGVVEHIGTPRNVSLRYEVLNTYINDKLERTKRPKDPKIKIKKIIVNNSTSGSANLKVKDDIEVTIDFMVHESTEIQFNLFFLKTDGSYYAGINTTKDLKKFTPKPGHHKIVCTIKGGQLIKGDYRIGAGVYTTQEPAEMIDILDSGPDSPTINILDKSLTQDGLFYVSGKWESSS